MISFLLNEKSVWTVLIAWAALSPLLGIALWAIGRKATLPWLTARRQALFGLSGPLVFGAWLFYNAVVDRFDLDSLTGIAVNFAAFTLAGIAGGLLWRRCARPTPGTSER